MSLRIPYLILVGEGKLREKIQKYVKENNVTNVVFAGLREDLENIYPIFDIFLFPSLREGLPGALLRHKHLESVVLFLTQLIELSIWVWGWSILLA